jgi:hypothetical protein
MSQSMTGIVAAICGSGQPVPLTMLRISGANLHEVWELPAFGTG